MAWSRVYEIPFDKIPFRFNLHGLSDLQIGSRSTIEDAIKMRIEEILEDPDEAGVAILGDIEDEDRPSTRVLRKKIAAERDEVVHRDAQKHMAWVKQHVIPILLPLQKLKHGIMAILGGHHFTQLTNKLNSAQFIAYELGRLSGRKVPYLGQMSAFMDLRFLDQRFPHRKNRSVRHVVHIQHGTGGGSAKGSALRKLDLTAHGFEATSFMRAHDCQVEAAKTDQLYPKEHSDSLNPEILSRQIGYLNLGAATQGYERTKGPPAYPEDAMMRPTAMDWGTIKLTVRQARAWEDKSKNLKIRQRIEI